MIDIGMMCREFIRRGHEDVQRLIEITSWSKDQFDKYLPFIFAIHDLGKDSPSFQCKWAMGKNQMENLGYFFPTQPIERFRHEYEVSNTLSDIFPYMYSKMKYRYRIKPEYEQLHRLIEFGIQHHHGRFDAPHGKDDINEFWRELRQAHLDWIKNLFEIDEIEPIEILPGREAEATILFSGLLIQCDIIGSTVDYFPLDSLTSPNKYPVVSQKYAFDAAKDKILRTIPKLHPSTSFHDFFGFPPRPLQAALDNDSLDSKHSNWLSLFEAQTGDGKTEAAILHALRHNPSKIVFLMPSKATTDSMYKRFQKYIDDPNIIKVHSDSFRGLEVPEGGDPWFFNKHSAFMARYIVSTVDQALMSVLLMKFWNFKLSLLAGATVIFDEIHAYDIYMYEHITLLLKWLKYLGCNVIILTATLPDQLKSKIFDAWGKSETTFTSEYPAITHVNQRGDLNYLDIDNSKNRSRTIRHEIIKFTEMSKNSGNAAIKSANYLASRIANKAKNGAKIAVIFNTVSAARDFYNTMKLYFNNTFLLHAKFTNSRRQAIISRAESVFGKNKLRPQVGEIIVSTQIIEQSLDLDFDLMITQYCPVDLWFQRIGRLFRHDVIRLKHLSKPEIWTLIPQGSYMGKSAYIYDQFILQKSLIWLVSHTEISDPDDIREAINEVYNDFIPEKVTDVYFSVNDMQIAKNTREIGTQKMKDKARSYEISEPEREDFERMRSGISSQMIYEENLEQKTDVEDEELEDWPTTRWIRENIGVIISDDPAFFQIDSNRRKSDEIDRILQNQVVLSSDRAVQHVKGLTIPKEWEKTPLRYYRPLLSSYSFIDSQGPKTINYDDELGLAVT